MNNTLIAIFGTLLTILGIVNLRKRVDEMSLLTPIYLIGGILLLIYVLTQ